MRYIPMEREGAASRAMFFRPLPWPTMNPLLYKAHPLLHITVDLLTNPSAHSLREAALPLLVYLAANFVWVPGVWWGANRAAGVAPSIALAYVLALPATVLYLGPMLTVLGDVLAHEFHFAERFILVFCLFVASQMLGVFYAVAIRKPGGGAVGLPDGLAVALFLWLLSLPAGLVLLAMNAEWKVL